MVVALNKASFTEPERKILYTIIDILGSRAIESVEQRFRLKLRTDNREVVLSTVSKLHSTCVACGNEYIHIINTYVLGEDYVSLEFNKRAINDLILIHNTFSKSILEVLLQLKGKHTVRIYELMVCHEKQKLSIEELNSILGTKYSTYSDIYKRALKPSQDELLKHNIKLAVKGQFDKVSLEII